MANDDQEMPAARGLDDEHGVQIGNRYRVLPGSRLPELDLDGTEAVAARDEQHPSESVFARVCAPLALPRVEMMASLKHMKDAAVMRPLEWGPVRMPGEDRPRLAVVFEKPEHDVLMPAEATGTTPFANDTLTRQLLGPMVLTLGYFAQRAMTHRSIRPSNIYWSGAGRDSILLGDCVTDGPAMHQPALFETISSAMTPPIGRGDGLSADDFYSLGVTLLILATGQCALFGASDAEVIEAKVSRGSYAALMGSGRTPFGLRDVLRGLLMDDINDRWGITELEQWLIGGIRTVVQEQRRPGAGRAFEFEGRQYTNCRALAYAFNASPKAGAKAGADPEFQKWLLRNAADKSMADRVRAILRTNPEPGASRTLDARQLARVCAALDAKGPIRYKSLIAKGPALGNVLADAFLRQDKSMIALVGETIGSGLALEWYLVQSSDLQMLYEKQIQQMKILQRIVGNSGMGHGIERCLYALSPSFACYSDVLEGYFVTDVRDLLPTLEEIVRQRGKLSKLVDRHLAAFIAARSKINLDRRFAALEAAKGDVNLIKLAMLSILATIQHRYGPTRLPQLTEWLARDLEPTINRFHARSTREELRKRLAAAAGSARLTELHTLLNNDKTLRGDELAQRKAMREFVNAGREIAQLQSKEFEDSVQELAWRIAAGLSSTVAGATAAYLLLI